VEGATATFTFTGRGVGFVTTLASTRGRVKVYVDGRYVRTLDNTGALVGYLFQDYVDVPFTVFDLDTGQQKAAAFLESQATANGQWDPSDAGNGGREAIWTMDDDGAGNANADYPGNGNYTGNTPEAYFLDSANADLLGGTLPLRYELFPRRVSASAVIDMGDRVDSSRAYRPGQMTSSPSIRRPASTPRLPGRASEKPPCRIHALAHSTYELNRFNRVLKFTICRLSAPFASSISPAIWFVRSTRMTPRPKRAGI
jgi:hypothetical protein